MVPEIFKHYTLGIPKIDDEHLRLINMMENVLECSNCEEHTQCRSKADALEQCFEDHLQAEEEYMERIKYPYLEAHIAQHMILRHELHSCVERLKDDKFKPDKFTTQKLRDIFVRHIDEQDLQIASYIKKM